MNCINQFLENFKKEKCILLLRIITHNEGKSVVTEKFIRTLKNKIYKHMTANSENVYFNVLNDIGDEYNNKYHKTIKMKPIDVKMSKVILLLNIMKNLMKKILNSKQVIMSGFQSIRIFLLKDMLLTGVKIFFCYKANNEYNTLDLCN